MNRSIESLPEYVTKFVVYSSGLLLAILFGLAAGVGNFQQIGKIFCIILAIFYVLFIQDFTWKIIYFLSILGLNFSPGGFALGSGEIACSFLFCLFAATWWRKEKADRPIEMKSVAFNLFNLSLFMWIGYCILHMLYNIFDPYWAGDIALKNLLKTYMQWTGLPIAVLYFINRPQALKVKSDFPKTIGFIFLICLVFNLSLRIYAFSTGRYGVDETLTASEIVQSMFYIPLIGAGENPYVLRGLAPAAILASMVFLHSEWIRYQRRSQKITYLLILCMGILGAFLSGGRITLVFAAVLAILVLAFQKRYKRLSIIIFTAICLIVCVNILYHSRMMERMPPMVLRSSAIAIIGKGQDAKLALQGSNDWRYALFQAALAEWKSDPRIFWFGRATYSYGYADDLDRVLHGGEGVMNSSLRRGATHNLLTDILIVYGLVGFFLFIFLVASFMILVWGIYRRNSYQNPNVEPAVRCLALFAFLNTGISTIYGFIAGSSGIFDGFILLLIVSRIHAVFCEKSSIPAAKWVSTPMLGKDYLCLPESPKSSTVFEGNMWNKIEK